MGAADELADLMNQLAQHEDNGEVKIAPSPAIESGDGQDLVEKVLMQEEFDDISWNVAGIEWYHFNASGGQHPHAQSWTRSMRSPVSQRIEVPETILAPAVRDLRLAFTVNKKHGIERSLKRGRKLDKKNLARRMPVEDYRVFAKRSVPSKLDYFVVLGMDCSGSTGRGPVNAGLKTMVFAQATLLDRCGIPFAVYAHTGTGGRPDLVQMYVIKGPDEPWRQPQLDTLAMTVGSGCNLDGHTMEAYRKVIMSRREKVKILCYYTDGAMPASNYEEEKVILEREIDLMDKAGIIIVGVGWNTDSPKQYGLDTVEVSGAEDTHLVVKKLQQELA